MSSDSNNKTQEIFIIRGFFSFLIWKRRLSCRKLCHEPSRTNFLDANIGLSDCLIGELGNQDYLWIQGSWRALLGSSSACSAITQSLRNFFGTALQEPLLNNFTFRVHHVWTHHRLQTLLSKQKSAVSMHSTLLCNDQHAEELGHQQQSQALSPRNCCWGSKFQEPGNAPKFRHSILDTHSFHGSVKFHSKLPWSMLHSVCKGDWFLTNWRDKTSALNQIELNWSLRILKVCQGSYCSSSKAGLWKFQLPGF